MSAKVLICGDGINLAKENMKALSIENEIRADEREKVINTVMWCLHHFDYSMGREELAKRIEEQIRSKNNL